MSHNYTTEHYVELESLGSVWRPNVYESFAETEQGRCALRCQYDTDEKCAYYYFESDVCYFGNNDYALNINGSSDVTVFMNKGNKLKSLNEIMKF